MTQTEIEQERQLLHQTIEEDVVLLRANGVRIWNWDVLHKFKLIRLEGSEEEELRAADIAISLALLSIASANDGLVHLRVSVTSNRRWYWKSSILLATSISNFKSSALNTMTCCLV